jgi:hypothetical protein
MTSPTQTPPQASEPPPAVSELPLPDDSTTAAPSVSVPPEPPEPPEVICDDSDTVRFLSNTDGGFVDQYYSFMEYGHQLLAIDGHCNYWVTTAADGWVRTGQVTEAEVQDLALQASYGNWDSFGDYQGDSCDDGAGTVLWDSEAALLCVCGCDGEGAPAGYPEAFKAARMLSTDLFELGEQSTDGLQLLVVADVAERFSDEGVPWPLPWDPASIAIPNEESFNINPMSGQLIEEQADRELLRAMRADYAANMGSFNYQAVHVFAAAGDGGTEQHYLVFLRDEVPAAVRAARVAAGDAAQ